MSRIQQFTGTPYVWLTRRSSPCSALGIDVVAGDIDDASTLDDTRKWIPLSDTRMPTLHGHFKCPHFETDVLRGSDARHGILPERVYRTSYIFPTILPISASARGGLNARFCSGRFH